MPPTFTLQHLAAVYAGPLTTSAMLSPAGSAQRVAGRGFFDAPGAVVDGMLISEPSLRLMAATWPTAREGDTVTLAGVDHQVRQILPIDDGAEKRLVLARV